MKKMKMALAKIAVATAILVACNTPTEQKANSKQTTTAARSAYNESLAKVDHTISFDDAKKFIKRFRTFKNEVAAGKVKDSLSGITPRYETFNSKDIQSLLGRDKIIGLRIYYGINNENKVVQILFGVLEGGQLDKGLVKEMGQNPPPDSDIVTDPNSDSDSAVLLP